MAVGQLTAQYSACGCRYFLSRLLLGVCLTLSSACVNAQSAPVLQPGENPAQSQSPASSPNPTSWLVRDPATGRIFQQQLIQVSTPVTKWEAKTVEQTVYEPKLATQVHSLQRTTFAPRTQYVMQPKLRGWWNPMKQPVQAYEYVPVTHWVPQIQQIPQPVTTQQWVAKPQKVVVYQPIASFETRQQLVQTEVRQPAGTVLAASSQPRPWFRLPLLAQQRQLPSPTALARGPYAPYAPSLPALPPVSLAAAPPSYPNSGLRAIMTSPQPSRLPLDLPRFATRAYAAPLQTVTSTAAIPSRDNFQSGMQPTVLR